MAWLGEVPEHWKIFALRRVAKSRCDGPFGSGLKSEHYSDFGVRVVRLQNIGHAEFKNGSSTFISEDYYATLGDHDVTTGDLLIAGLGDEGIPAGRACVVPEGIEPAMVKADCFRFRLDEMMVSPPFAALQLTSTAEGTAGALSTGSTRQRINLDSMAGRPILIPPLEEQVVIAAFLDRETARIDALLAKKERLIALLQEKRAALISRAVTKGLDPSAPMKDSGVAWLGEVPVHWEALKLTRVASLHSGHTPSRLHPEYWKNCTIPWISLGDVWQLRSGRMEYIEETKEKISELGLRNSSAELLPAGTVILSRTASVGFSGIMATSMATTQDYANWVCGPRMLPEYLLQVLRCMKQEFDRLTMGSTHQTIYMPDIEAFRTPLPPIEEQQQIIEHVRSIQQQSERLENAIAESIRLAREYRTAMISAAVTGKIDVRGEVPA